MHKLSGLIGALMALFVSTASAQGFPAKPVTLIVPFPPGGSTDIVGRIVADGLTKALGQAVVVENRGGAGGAIGAKAVADAAPDGYTLGMATVSTHVINPAVRGSKLGYQPIENFTHISQLAAVPNVVSVHPGVPARTVGEFIDHLKKNPDKLAFATPGPGSLGHMMGETFKYNGKVAMIHAAYRGAGPALNDTLAGHVQVLFDNLPSSLPHIQAGKLRALAVAADRRLPALPDVPTFAEAGLPLVNDPAWFGLIGPAGLPPEIVQKLHQAVVAVLKQPEIVKKLEGVMAQPVGGTPEAFRQTIAASLDNTRKIIAEAQLKFE